MTLDEAWEAAEAALPDGWRIDGLHNSSDGWFAVALGKGGEEFTDTDYCDSPTAALQALAASLTTPVSDDTEGAG